MTSPATPEDRVEKLVSEFWDKSEHARDIGDLSAKVAAALREAEERGAERERAEIKRILGFGVVTEEPSEGIGIVFHDPYYDLEGALIDLERQHADEVCIRTIRRVQNKLLEVEKRGS